MVATNLNQKRRGAPGSGCQASSLAKKKMRQFITILGSTLLWFIPIFSIFLCMELLNDARTTFGWEVFWRDLPIQSLTMLGSFLIVALIMNFTLKRIILSLNGWRFWLFPFISLPIASVAYWLTNILAISFTRGNFTWSTYELIGGIFYVLVVVLLWCIWLTYPLALLNQVLIRRVHKTNG
jgi:hypothetical protein